VEVGGEARLECGLTDVTEPWHAQEERTALLGELHQPVNNNLQMLMGLPTGSSHRHGGSRKTTGPCRI
jgi:hypothetical protein